VDLDFTFYTLYRQVFRAYVLMCYNKHRW
jgi:hypothetical protein